MERQRGQPCLFIILTLALGTLDGSPTCRNLFVTILLGSYHSLWKRRWKMEKFLYHPKSCRLTMTRELTAHHQWMKPSLCIIPQITPELFLCRVCELMFRFMSAPQKASMKHFMGYQTGPGRCSWALLSSHTMAVIHAAWKSTARRPHHLRQAAPGRWTWVSPILNNHCLAQKVSKMSDVGRMRGLNFGERDGSKLWRTGWDNTFSN